MTNETNTQITTMPGGTVKLTIGQQPSAAEPTSPHQPSRVYGGVTRFSTMPGAEAEHTGQSKYTVGQDAPSGSVAATLQIVNGAPTMELIPGVSASRTHIRQALADGLIEAAGDGQYRDTNQVAPLTPPSAAARPPAEAPADPGEFFLPGEADIYDAGIAHLPQHAYDEAGASVVTAITQGAESLDTAVTRLAASAGIEVAEASEIVHAGYEVHERTVARAIAKLGIDESSKPAFYEWVREHKARDLGNAVRSVSMIRDLNPFRQLATEYIRHNSAKK